MTILNRYLTRLFCMMMGITIPGLTGIYLLVHFIENVDEFLDAGTDTYIIIKYFLLLIPGLVYELAPLAILLAGLLSTMLITKNMEMLALRSSGISPRAIARPFFITALAASFCLLCLYAFVIPQANSEAASIKASVTSTGANRGTLIGSQLFYRGTSSILKAEVTRPDATELRNVMWYFFNDDYTLKKMIAAKQARFLNGMWHFSTGITTSGGNGRVSFFQTLVIRLSATPQDFVSVKKPADQMDIATLASAVHHMRMQGLPCGELETKLWGHILYPFLSVLLLMVGLPLTISRIKGALSMSFGLGMAIGLSAWILWNLLMTLGVSGTLPGFLAPLLTLFLVGGTGLFSMRRYGMLE